MPIRKKFIIVGVVSLMVTLVVGFFMYQSSYMVNREIQKEKVTSEIKNDVFARAILRDDYLQHRDETPVIQFQASGVQMDQLLTQASTLFTSNDDKTKLGLIASNKHSVDQAFSQVVENYKNQGNALSELATAKEQLLVSQILIKSQDNINITTQLDVESRGNVTVNEERTRSIGLVFIITLSLVTILGPYLIWLSIGKPIVLIKEAAARIAALDFTTTTTTSQFSNDEIGELAKSFNIMVGRLKEAYEKLSGQTQDLHDTNRAALNVLEDLQTEKTKYESLITSIGEGVVATDNLGRIIVINPAAEKILGLHKADVYGKLVLDVIKIVDGTGKAIPKKDRPIEKATTYKKPFSTSTESDYYYVRSDGSKIPVGLDAAPVIVGDKLLGVIDVFRDISRQKDIDRMKTEFVSLASHQLRTPLTSIKWYLEMILDKSVGKLNKDQEDYLNDVYQSNETMIKLVNALLNISRIESGRLTIEPKPTDLIALFRQTVEKLKPQLEANHITLIDNIKDGLPVINVDPILVSNVYANLLGNALKYTHEGGKILISIDNQNGFLVSSVKDTGIGIPLANQQYIFQRFYRGSNVSYTSIGSTGLGLYLAKEVVESSGGKIWFESKEGQGSTFSFSLPLSGSPAKKGEVTLS